MHKSTEFDAVVMLDAVMIQGSSLQCAAETADMLKFDSLLRGILSSINEHHKARDKHKWC